MKWFKHDTDASSDIKIKRLEEEFGNDGYAVFFKTCELLGKEGLNARLKLEKLPKNWISYHFSMSEENLTKIFNKMGELSLCCRKSLKKGEIYIPNFKRRADDYTKRVRRNYEESTENVPLEEKRIEQIRINKIMHSFKDAFKEKTGFPYCGVPSKDYPLVRNMLIAFNNDEALLKLIDVFFNKQGWWSDKLSIGVFKSVLPQLSTLSKVEKPTVPPRGDRENPEIMAEYERKLAEYEQSRR